MSYRIYCHTNRVTGKQYIGYTRHLMMKRWTMHLKLVNKGSGLLFHNSIRKHGSEQWDHDIIVDDISTLDEAKCLERHFIEMMGTWGFGYNMTPGGDGSAPGFQKGRIFSDAHREKLRQAKLGTKTGRKIPPQMAAARRALKGTQSPIVAAKLGWQRRRERAKPHV